MKFLSVVGARPDFVQVGVLSKELRKRHDEIMVHTGQHYDDEMSDVFFRDLGLPRPEINLGVGSMAISAQVGTILERLSAVVIEHDPDAILVRGDTSGTIGGALVAKYNLYPLVHIEAGCRSFDRTMPEELNRITADHLADVCVTTDDDLLENLRSEGIKANIYSVGDPMYDTYLVAVSHLGIDERPKEITEAAFDLLTIHRAENTDNRERLASMMQGFASAKRAVIFPAHPRTRARLEQFNISVPETVKLINPLGYLDMIRAERSATVIFTDSGGVQREAYYGGIPCVTLRDNTEWVNTIEAGWNRLVGASSERIAAFTKTPPPKPAHRPQLFGDGTATLKTIAILESESFVELTRIARKHRMDRAG